jgi:hypothetical protein
VLRNSVQLRVAAGLFNISEIVICVYESLSKTAGGTGIPISIQQDDDSVCLLRLQRVLHKRNAIITVACWCAWW